MRRTLSRATAGWLIAAALAFTGCSSGDSPTDSGAGAAADQPGATAPPPPPPAPPPPTSATAEYSSFVSEQFEATADDSDPVSVDGMDFSFENSESPDAFDHLLE